MSDTYVHSYDYTISYDDYSYTIYHSSDDDFYISDIDFESYTVDSSTTITSCSADQYYESDFDRYYSDDEQFLIDNIVVNV